MSSSRSSQWPLILIYMLVLRTHHLKVLGVDPVSPKLRRLNEQFQQFRALTEARLEMLALNQNRNTSEGLWSRLQVLSEHWQHMSQDLQLFKQSTTQEIEGLREWSRKLEKKSKRFEGRLALMARSLRENRRRDQKKKHDPAQDFLNLTVELQSQEARLAALQAQRDELLVGLRGLQESLTNQVLRVTRLEGRLSEVLLDDGDGGKPSGWILDRQTKSRSESTNQEGNNNQSGPASHSGNPSQPHQYQITSKQHQLSKAQESKPQSESHPRIQLQHANSNARATDDRAQPNSYSHQSQGHVPSPTRSYPIQQEQLHSHPVTAYNHTKVQHLTRQQSKPQVDIMSRIHPQDSDSVSGLQSESDHPWVSGSDGGEEEESVTEDSQTILKLLQLPLRQKIPAQPAPKKAASICNVDSMLIFPSASADNYVTFSVSLPNLLELSVCLWLQVEESYVGTLLSYATDDNDNQLVLYERSSSASSSSSRRSSSSSSSPSLDFVIGDPVYRRLPVMLLLDARWHHLCIVWSSIQGHFWHYIDRQLTSSGSNFRRGWEIPGGGSVVLGQEQDTVGGGFDPAEGFTGQVAGFRMWNRVLSPAEVEGVADGRGVPRGVVLGMEDIKEVHGEVEQISCECLENCV